MEKMVGASSLWPRGTCRFLCRPAKHFMELGSGDYEQAFWAYYHAHLNPGTKQLLSRKSLHKSVVTHG